MAAIAMVASISAGVTCTASMLCVRAVAATLTADVVIDDASLERNRGLSASLAGEASLVAGSLSVDRSALASIQFANAHLNAAIDRQPTLGATLAGEAEVSPSLGLAISLSTNGPLRVDSSLSACLDPGRGSLGACDIVRESLVLWGIEDIANAPGHARRRAIHDFNASLQEVWNNAKDRNYWTRSTLEVAFAEGVDSYDLADSVQNVIGSARTSSGRPLVPLGSRGELDQYEDLFMDERDASGFPLSTPSIYYVERLNQSGKDPSKCILHIRPAAPSGGSTVKIDVVLESPRFTWSDVDVCRVVPMPHRYVESLLLPIIRFRAMSHYLFIAQGQEETIRNEYLMAKGMLESADPLPGKSGDNTNDREDPRT